MKKLRFPSAIPFPYTRAMTDFSDLLKADNQQPARSIQLVDAKGYDAWLAARPA